MRLIDYVQQGGPIMYLLVIMNIVGLTFILWRLFSLLSYQKDLKSHSQEIVADLKSDSGAHMPVEMVKDAIREKTHSLEFGLNAIRIIAGIAPLLGLLGTVVGIQGAFENISGQQNIDPSQFSGNLSMALLTTIGGLVVAIPHFIGHSYLSGLLEDIEKRMENFCMKALYRRA